MDAAIAATTGPRDSFEPTSCRMGLLGPGAIPRHSDCTSTVSTRPAGSPRPMQQSDARDSELICVQSDQRMHWQGFEYLLAESYANPQCKPAVTAFGRASELIKIGITNVF
jgi:hypothetical protein